MWHWGAKLFVRTYKLWQPGQGSGTGSSLPTSVSGWVTSFLLFICVRDRPHFAAQHNVLKVNTENSDFFVFVFMMIVFNQFLLQALSWLTVDCLLKKVNKPATHQPVPVNGQGLTRQWWQFLFPWRIPGSRIPNAVLLSIRIVHNTAVGTRGWISAT